MWLPVSQGRASLQQRLSGTITDQDQRQLKGQLTRVEEEIRRCESEIQTLEEMICSAENTTAESQEEERKEGEVIHLIMHTVMVLNCIVLLIHRVGSTRLMFKN